MSDAYLDRSVTKLALGLIAVALMTLFNQCHVRGLRREVDALQAKCAARTEVRR